MLTKYIRSCFYSNMWLAWGYWRVESEDVYMKVLCNQNVLKNSALVAKIFFHDIF
jgi:hypothetical protein